jgi:hypothetical protein
VTDIVKRLRSHPGEGQTVTEQFRNMVEQRHEAAAEIERLEAEIRQIELNTREGSPLVLKLNWLARRALEPKP